MDQPEVAQLIKEMITDNLDISIYRYREGVEVELYWDGIIIAQERMADEHTTDFDFGL